MIRVLDKDFELEPIAEREDIELLQGLARDAGL